MKLVADIVYNLQLEYDLNGLDEVKDPVEDAEKTPEKTSVKDWMNKLKVYKLKSQLISESPDASNSIYESLNSSQTLRSFIGKLNGQNIPIPLLEYELSRADSVPLPSKPKPQQFARKKFKNVILRFL